MPKSQDTKTPSNPKSLDEREVLSGQIRHRVNSKSITVLGFDCAEGAQGGRVDSHGRSHGAYGCLDLFLGVLELECHSGDILFLVDAAALVFYRGPAEEERFEGIDRELDVLC
jgi:hypothetical protein